MLVTSVIAGTAVAADGDAANTAETQAQPQTTARTVDKTVKSSDAAAQDDGSVVYSVDVPVAGGDGASAGSVTVDVTAPAGALPDGVSLEAAPVSDMDAVASELSDADVDYAGLLALDVRFTDADGGEVEPSAPVSVSFETPRAVLGDGVDVSSVMVRHFVEDETGKVTKVETVADAGDESDGTVSVGDGVQALSADTDADASDASVTAEFTVGSFSSFTITWDSGRKTYFNLTVHYVDENGNEIQGTHNQNASISRNQTITFSDYAGSIQGYTYQAAHYEAVDGAVITSVTATGHIAHTLTFYNGRREVETNDNTAYDTSDTKYRDIYLVYKQDSSHPGTGDASHGITFVYYDEDDINDGQAIYPRNAIKYSIVLIDANGREHYDLPQGSTVTPSVSFEGDTVNMTSTATYEQMGISVPGYTFDNSYAYFYWKGNYQGEKNDVVLFHNFGANSTKYGSSYDSYIGFTRSDAQGSDYSQQQFGNAGQGYFAYNPTGTLRIVLHQVTGSTHYQAHFVDAYLYGEGNSQPYATTDMTTGQEDGHYYGTLAALPKDTPTREGYTFNGWYMDMDEDGNGTGTRVDDPSDDTTHYRTDATYYAKWVKNGTSGGGEVTQEATVTTGKTAVLRDDGNYDLTLTVSGDRGTSENKQKVDVLFILDKSGSMTSSRMTQLKSAVNPLVDTVEDNDGIDARYAAVAFAGDGGGNHGSTYTTDTNGDAWRDGAGIKTFVQSISADGGTNYQRAIHEGKTLLNGADDDALTFVVFVSDGIPTYRGNDDDAGNGQDDDERGHKGENISSAVTEISTMSCDYFYAIGMGSDFGQENVGSYWQPIWVDKQGTKNLKKLANSVKATSKGDGNVYSASDTQGMQNAFNRITGDITHFAAKDVTVTDPLSQYADLVLTDGVPQFTITVKHGEQTWPGTVGNNGTVTFPDAHGNNQTATARVSSDNRTIYLDLPDDYELEEGYTYSISTVIAPSQAAKSAGMDSDAAKQTPDDNTGTHSETNPKQQGFWSNNNENAKVTYTANGEEGSKNFPKPVIQVREPSEFIYKAHLALKKSLPGGVLDDDHKFTFQLTDLSQGAEKATFKTSSDAEGKTCVETDPTEPSACTVTNKTSDGSEAHLNDFGDVTFPGPGVYMFKVNEVQPDPSERDNGIVYDEHALYVLYVIGKDNKMARYIHYDGSGEEDVTAPCSTNEGCSPSDNVWVPAGSDIVSEATSVSGIEGISEKLVWTNHLKVSALPLTGGDATARNVLLAGGGVLLLAGAAWLLARRRRV
ncbi:DUF7604 domain-containing protein [Bifidobacterium pullorum]|uniref:DUF7604 domain-containing protein n=1 Tax=Bifidobacterium pullorum TaxID=78448 RepID=UPI00307C8B96